MEQNQAGLVSPMQCTPYVVIDIETCHAPQEAIDAEIAAWKPKANTKDPGKIEQQRLAAIANAKEKSALLDAAPLSCIGISTPGARYMFNAVAQESKADIHGFNLVNCGNERDALIAMRTTLDTMTGPETVIVGHNIKGFDLPKVRARYLHHRLHMPTIFIPSLLGGDNQPMFDTMTGFLKYFTAQEGREQYISLEEISRLLDLDVPVKVISGKDMPRLVEEGHIDEVLLHCAVDVLAEEQCWSLLNGSALAA